MSLGRHIAPAGSAAKRGFVVLALLALSLVIARPICDAYAAGAGTAAPAQMLASDHAGNAEPHEDESAPCCSSLEDGALAASAAAFPAAEKPGSFAFLPPSPLEAWPATARRLAPVPPDRPPLSLPYHARTARLLI